MFLFDDAIINYGELTQNDTKIIAYVMVTRQYNPLIKGCMQGMNFSFYHITAQRLKDFRVVASDFKPPAPSGYNLEHEGYRECGRWKGIPAAGKVATLKCDEKAIGRYVYIFIPGTEYLTICEAEIYGLRKLLFISLIEG